MILWLKLGVKRMSTGNSVPATIRRGRPEDIESILDLLTEYELPRSNFEPFYLNDTSYHPEHSWLVEQNGRLLSHLRIYDRWIRVGRTKLHIAGIGNVITARDARGHGYVGKLMYALLSELPREGYAYSLLWTHLPGLYGRYGWMPIEQDLVRAVLPPSIRRSVKITPFQENDLPAIMRLYETANADRTGTTIRTPEYWRALPKWLGEDQDDFLIARDNAGDEIVGYIQSRPLQDTVEILELGVEESTIDIGRTLLAAASIRRNGQLQGQFPPSQWTVFYPGEFEIVPETGLMGRVINLAELLHSLKPMWRDLVHKAGMSQGAFSLSASAGSAKVQVTNRNIQVATQGVAKTVLALNELEFAHLLFHGFDERAKNLIEDRMDTSLLRVLFPKQDFVIWQADSF